MHHVGSLGDGVNQDNPVNQNPTRSLVPVRPASHKPARYPASGMRGSGRAARLRGQNTFRRRHLRGLSRGNARPLTDTRKFASSFAISIAAR